MKRSDKKKVSKKQRQIKPIAKFFPVYVDACQFLVDEKTTIRGAGSKFDLATTTLHRFIHTRLIKYDKKLWKKVLKRLDINRKESSSRGGTASARNRVVGKK